MRTQLQSQSNTDESFYQHHLERVSRSFAYCIQQIEAPLREWTGLAYLLCRVLDTVEDTPWPTKDIQLKKMREFLPLFKKNNLSDTQNLAVIQAWMRGFSHQLTTAEKALIEDMPRLVTAFKKCPQQVQRTLESLMSSMANGMIHFLERSSAASQQKISNLSELNEYCFFVAGVVGEAMTHLVNYKGGYRDQEFSSSENIRRSFHFGLFLQKVNILKDQFKDEKEGRSFICDRAQVLESLWSHAEQTLAYIKTIPLQEKGYRVFCATSFFLGLATVPLLKIQDETLIEPKLEKSAALELFQEIETIAESNSALEERFERYAVLKPSFNLSVGESADSLAALPRFAAPDWFFESYQGFLGRNEIQL